MSVLIKDMEMPECCGYCPFEYKNYCMAKPSLKVERTNRHPHCPLVPAADVQPVVLGKWIDTDNYYWRWKCSACGCHTRDAAPNYCPNCGVKMEKN